MLRNKIAALGLLMIAWLLVRSSPAMAQWSGTNPLTTLSRVGIGTTNPTGPLEVSNSGLVRLRISGNSPNPNNVGLRLTTSGALRWSVAGYDVQFTSDNVFTIYNEMLGKAAIDVVTNNDPAVNLGAIALRIHGPASVNGSLTVGNNAFRCFGPPCGMVNPTDGILKLGDSSHRWSKVWAVNGTIQTSDARKKEGITPLGYGIKELGKLRPVSFQWRSGDDARAHLGFLAQEVEKVVPEVVVRGDGKDDPLGMQYGGLVPVLVRAIQEQQAKIERRAKRIAELESARRRASFKAWWPVPAALALPVFGLGMISRKRRRAETEPSVREPRC